MRLDAEGAERQTLADKQLDIVVVQDLFEHIFRPYVATHGIVRMLKPGRADIMSVPIVREAAPPRRRAAFEEDGIRRLAEPKHYRSPVGDGKRLATYDWGGEERARGARPAAGDRGGASGGGAADGPRWVYSVHRAWNLRA